MKNRKVMYILLGIAFVVYSAIVWLIPWEKNTLLVLSYIFSLIAFTAQGILWKFAWEDSDTAMNKFYGIPILRLGIIYLMIQVIIGFIVMAASTVLPYWIAILIYILLLGAFAFAVIVATQIKEQIDTMEVNQKQETHFIKRLRVEASYLYDTYTGNEKLRQISEKLKYSDPVSAEELQEEEKELALLLEQIKQSLQEGKEEESASMADEFLAKLEKRNQLCKMYK